MHPLLALSLTTEQVVIVILACIAGAAIVGLLKRVDNRIEARRLASADLAGVLVEEGYDRVADLARKYSVGDYDGFAHALKALVAELLNKETRMALLVKPFEKQLANALKDPERREKIRRAIELAMAAEKQSQVADASGKQSAS